MTAAASTTAEIRAALAGVRALLLDMDGVLVLRGKLIPGADEALAQLDGLGIPWVIVTNVSLQSRASLARDLAAAGLPIRADRIVTASSASAGYVKRRFGDRPLFVMAKPDALTEFEGLNLLSWEAAAASGAAAAAVVVGDASEDFTARNMQSAFALLRGGARFIAMHKNRWWITPAGVMMDSGAYVAALEFATQRRALVTGKPSPAFFGEGRLRLAELAGGSELPPEKVAMVGDDLWNDIRGAQKAGLRGIFVRSGKHGDAELARLGAERGHPAPDAIAASIVEIAAALAS